jgi:hypothetical protein
VPVDTSHRPCSVPDSCFPLQAFRLQREAVWTRGIPGVADRRAGDHHVGITKAGLIELLEDVPDVVEIRIGIPSGWPMQHRIVKDRIRTGSRTTSSTWPTVAGCPSPPRDVDLLQDLAARLGSVIDLRAQAGGKVPFFGTSRSLLASSSTFTSLNVTTRTDFTNLAGRYTSQTHASFMSTSK